MAVERVIDGDTIVVTGGRHVRLIGIDTPETVDPHRPVGCFGKEASAFMKQLLPAHTAVRLVGDVEQLDRYGRTLAYVYRLADGLFVNAELVRRGYAVVLTIPPNVAHTDEFVALASAARVTGAGLWSACPAPAGSPPG
jgi:micrococcal nuclease